jgi:hypothetical protein
MVLKLGGSGSFQEVRIVANDEPRGDGGRDAQRRREVATSSRVAPAAAHRARDLVA